MVENPANGHAHAVWALTEPVTRTEYAHRKSLALAAAVSEGLRRSVDGDQGYFRAADQEIPVHGAWNTVVCHAERLYRLTELAGCL